MDDRTAIEKCRGGDAEAFRHLVHAYQGQAYGHALAVLGRREDARDALQEAFLKAYRALPRFRTGRRFYPWFYVILRNCCFRLLRRRGREEATGDAGDIPVAASPGGEGEEVRAALGALSARDREILLLRHFDGLTYEELAERLGVPRGTVMSRLYHARRRLRVRLEPPGGRRGGEEEG